MTRRATRNRADSDFTVHLQLARTRAVNRRLNRAAALLLLSALLTWLFKFPFALQLTAVLAAGVTAFAWPVRGAQTWSRNWIRSHAGLAYETALQLEQLPRDSFGLRVAVRSHARTSIARMERPQYQSWWLAGVVLTILILLLPVLNFSSPWNPPGPRSPLQGNGVPAAVEQQDGPADPAAEEAAATEASEPDTPEPASQQASEAAAPEGAAADSDAAAGTGDSAVLDRFLDNLRPRPAEEETQQVEAASTQPLGAQADTPETDTETEADEEAELEDMQPGGAQQQAAGSPGDTTADSDAAAAEGSAEDALADDTEEMAETEAAGEEGNEAGASQAEEPLAGPDSSDGASATAEGDTLEQGSDGTGIGGGADDSAGEGGRSEPSERLASAGGEAEFLEGQLTGDAANSGGTVRLPAFTDVELPLGSSATEFTRAAERAVTEGQVPLEYQQIIRNYFQP